MIRLAVEKLPASNFANGFSIAHSDLATNRRDMRAAFDFHSFEGKVIEIYLVGLGRDLAAIIGIVNDQVRVRAQLDGAVTLMRKLKSQALAPEPELEGIERSFVAARLIISMKLSSRRRARLCLQSRAIP